MPIFALGGKGLDRYSVVCLWCAVRASALPVGPWINKRSITGFQGVDTWPTWAGKSWGGHAEKKERVWRSWVSEVLLSPDVPRGNLLSGPMCELSIGLQTVVTLEGSGNQGLARGERDRSPF